VSEAPTTAREADDAGTGPLDFDAIMRSYAEALPKRDQVPSDREAAELEAAGRAYSYEPPPPPPVQERAHLWRAVRRGARALMPWNIDTEGASKWPMYCIALIQSLGQLDTAAFPLLLVLYISVDLGSTFDLITLLVTLQIVSLLIGPAIGLLVDRVKRVWVLRIGLIVTHLGTIATGMATGPAALFGARALGGLGPALTTPVQPSLLGDWYSWRVRHRVFFFSQIVAGIVALVGSLALIQLVSRFIISWQDAMIYSGLFATIVALLSFTLREPLRGEMDRQEAGDNSHVVQPPLRAMDAFRVCMRIATLRKLWFAAPFLAIGNLGVMLYAIGQLQNATGFGAKFAHDPRYIGLLPIVSTGIGVPALIYGQRFVSRVTLGRPGRIMSLAGGILAIQGFAVMVIVLFKAAFLLLPMTLIIGAIAGPIQPAQATLTTNIIPARVRGFGSQIQAPLAAIGLVVLPFINNLGKSHVQMAGLLLSGALFVGAFLTVAAGRGAAGDIRTAIAAARAEEDLRKSRASGLSHLLVVRDLDVSYDNVRVLFHIDLDVEEGQIVALLGTNGAGKSTLMRAICGLQQASAGAVFIDGEDVTQRPAHLSAHAGVVFLPGGRAVFPSLTVAENLRSAAWALREDSDVVHARLAEVLELFPALADRLDAPAAVLSGGEQQMLALGQALLMQPRLLMIDELSLGLAPAVVEQLLDTVRRIRAAGTTVILVEQSVNVALTIADRAIFMDKGEIRFDGATSDLLTRGDLVRSVYLGGSPGAYVGLGAESPRRDGEPRQVLRVSGIGLSYGGVTALEQVDLEVRQWEVVGIIGPNGAGKTSLFDVISGFTAPDRGSVSLDGVDITFQTPDARARLGLARSFQNTHLFPALTVREAVAVALERRLESRSALLAAAWVPSVRRSERRADRRVSNLLDLLGVAEFADKFVDELSTGSKRLVELACMMALEPAVLLLDEPSSGLAQAEIEVLGPVIQRLAAQTGCGVLVIEHDLPLLTAMSDRLVAMERGRVIATGDPDTVISHPDVVSAYLNADASVVQRSGELAGALAALTAPNGRQPA
jgi:branched-chain amino acid transport system ATP-binding protein